jgi:hypothetical protein
VRKRVLIKTPGSIEGFRDGRPLRNRIVAQWRG